MKIIPRIKRRDEIIVASLSRKMIFVGINWEVKDKSLIKVNRKLNHVEELLWIYRMKSSVSRRYHRAIKREQDCRSDSEHRVEDAVDDDDEEAENRRRRRRRIGARASGRVAAGIGSSLEIAVGWLPHRLGRFIRGSLGGRSGERATRRRLETCPEEDLS